MQTIKLNLIPGSVLPVVNVSQYDVGRHFVLQVYEGATAYDLTGKDVQIRGTKPDGNGFAYDSTDGAISVSTNTVTVTTLQQMTACGGQTMCELRITSGSDILGTINFILMVEPSALSDDTPISDTDIPAIERDMQDQVDAAEASALEAEGYAVGEQDGAPVGPDSPYYENNAKWYSEHMVTPDLDDLTNVNITTPTNGQALIYDSVNDEWVNGAGGGGSSTLAGLTDVTLTTPSSGEVLEYNGSKWENASLSIPTDLDDLSDVTLTTPSSGEFLKYDGSKWVNGSGGGGGASALNDLSDVTLTTPSAGQALIYDGAEWENTSLSIPSDLDDLSDVTLTTPTSGEVLQYDGTKWENNSLSIPADLDDLSDVQLTTPASGQFLKYDGSKWVNATGGGGGASALDDLTDVDITTPTDGQVLTYDSATQKWINAAGGGGDSHEIYAFHYSESDSSPASVDYPAGYDNSSFTDPAYMDFVNDVFHYGDWTAKENGILFPRSCMLKYDGTVDYYLDETDETKKEDGVTASDVANSAYAGNAMMEWGKDGKKIYWKIVPDSGNDGFTFVVANYKPDSSFEAWNHYNCEGNLASHFYLPKYFGSSDGTRLRSISGGTNYVGTNMADQVAKAEANNLNANKKLWTIEVYSDWLFETMIMLLLSKSTNTQAKYGDGLCNAPNAIGQGTMNGKGLFWGANNGTSGVKIFGRENPYGNIWRRLYGLNNVTGSVKIKLTYGQQDGSTVDGYNSDGNGYITHGTISGTNGSYISNMNITNRGLTPKTIAGTATTHYCDVGYFANNLTTVARRGGNWFENTKAGAFAIVLVDAPSVTGTDIGAAISCKPLA